MEGISALKTVFNSTNGFLKIHENIKSGHKNHEIGISLAIIFMSLFFKSEPIKKNNNMPT